VYSDWKGRVQWGVWGCIENRVEYLTAYRIKCKMECMFTERQAQKSNFKENHNRLITIIVRVQVNVQKLDISRKRKYSV
jgi:hypothetical protein